MSDSTNVNSGGTDDFPVRPWYQPVPKQIGPEIRRILEARGIPPSEVENHIVKVRDSAWRVQPYVCLGQFFFIEFRISTHPCVDEILDRLRTGNAMLLDVGCGLAQELRLLVDRGVESSQLVGMDVHDLFINLGYTLFQDKSALNLGFVTADILELDSIPSSMLHNFDIIWGSASFHLFNWENQVRAFRNAIRLLKDEVNVAIYGWQAGHPDTKTLPNPEKEGEVRWFWHNPASFEGLWSEIGKQTNTRWKITNWNGGKVENLSEDMAGVVQHFFAVKRISGAPGAETSKLDNSKMLWT